MYFRVFIKFRVCTCIHDTRYTIHDIDEFRVYTVTSLVQTSKSRDADLTTSSLVSSATARAFIAPIIVGLNVPELL